MRIERLITAIAAATAILALSASAAQAGEYARRGTYVGLNGAYGIDLFAKDFAGLLGVQALPIEFRNSWGVNARVGYRALSWLAAEIEYEWVQGIDIDLVGGANIATYEPHTLTGNIKLVLPTGRVQPYALAGGGLSFWTLRFAPGVPLIGGSGTGFGFRGGAGLDVYLTDNWVLNAEGTAVLNTSKFEITATPVVLDKLYYFSLSAGLAYRF